MMTETVKNIADRRLEPLAVADINCDSCRGWGVILGTDTPDHWGEPCPCGVEFRLASTAESRDLHAAHMQARLNGGSK